MTTRYQGGSLTVLSADRSEILGELTNADWKEEETAGGLNYILSGLAGEGTAETFDRLNRAGVENVSYDMDIDGDVYTGHATLLRPRRAGGTASAVIMVEASEPPNRV